MNNTCNLLPWSLNLTFVSLFVPVDHLQCGYAGRGGCASGVDTFPARRKCTLLTPGRWEGYQIAGKWFGVQVNDRSEADLQEHELVVR